MEIALKVTDQPQESSFSDMVSGDNVLSIPLFQRRYRWLQKNLDWLWNDMVDIRDGATKSVFLGVVVCVVRGASPGRPIPWEIVDGQQRLSTLYLLLLAAVEVAASKGAITYAAGVAGTYLLVRPLADNPINTKLVPSFADRTQFKKIWDKVMAVPGLKTEPTIAANPPRPPAPSGDEKGDMLSQYNRIRGKLIQVWNEGGEPALASLVNIAVSRLSIVSISLRDPIVAPKIFERLNNRAELVTTADLIRNEVFARSSDDPATTLNVFTNYWEPFVSRFAFDKNGLEKFLFPYGLIIKSSTTKAELFTSIRSQWATLDPKAIIEDMERFTDCFLALENNQLSSSIPSDIGVRLNRLYRLGKPSSTYAFILRLVYGVSQNEVDEAVAVSVLDELEGFLFRRAVCGIEPTGLHAVFKSLWSDLTTEGKQVSAEGFREAIESKPTINWPNDAQFEAAIRKGNLYDRKVCKFALTEYELACEGESPSDNFEIEHILPQDETEHWKTIFGEQYSSVLNTWPNLIPLTPRMNKGAGQAPYNEKREEYVNSIFATTRKIADDFTTWTPDGVATRANNIVKWALVRWPNAVSS